MAQTREAANVPVLGPDLSNVLERITDGFFALDSQWRITYMNAEAKKLLRTTEPNVIGQYWLDVYPKARGTGFQRNYERSMSEQVAVSFVEFSSTAQRWFEVKAYPSTDGVSVFFRDVSSRMRAEAELASRARQQTAILDFGRLALSGVELEQLMRDAIEMVTVYLEVPIAEVHTFESERQQFALRVSEGWGVREAHRQHLPVDSQAGTTLRLGQSVVTNDVRIDARFCDREGFAERGVVSGVCVLIGTSDSPLGVLSAYSDVQRTFTPNEVRFAESIATIVGEAMRWHEAQGAVRASNQRIREILESITDAFIAFDYNLCVTYVNRRMAAFYGMSREEMLGLSIETLFATGMNAEYRSKYRHAIETQRAVTFEIYNEEKGEWFETRLYPSPEGVSAYFREITKRKQAEMEVRELNAQLESRVGERTKQLEMANKELESFAYSVSHDLRAPLRAIDGFSQALEEDYGPQFDETAKSYMVRVRKAANRMANLIDALLRLAKVARVAMTYDPVDMTHSAAVIAAELRDAEPERDVEFRIEEGLTTFGEPSLLANVLQNLFANAWKFTKNCKHAVIEFGRTDDGEFFVRDNGAGFDMSYSNKLFGAFQRLHADDEFEGTGIGLATVARIVHRHGGSIRAQGQVDGGATFYFTLPSQEKRSA
ncbi:MAG: PAS domain-containing protein [Candidatus Eremiobacteraeota bacterium]|nr:PAS domain-containing protein [Candidatus Eremiobacteraeota bacterium]